MTYRIPAALAVVVAMVAFQPAAAAPSDQHAAPRRVAPGLPAVTAEGELFENMRLAGGAHVEQTSSGDVDADPVLAALRDIRDKGVLGVRDHEAALLKVLDDMPRPFVRVSHAGGTLTYRGNSMADCTTYATTLPKDPSGKAVSFDCKGNPFPTAALLLGSYYDEIGRYDRALEVLTEGLVAAPDAPLLVSEHGAALVALHRWPEVLASAERGLAIADLSDTDAARFHRQRGMALTELNKLDEAEAAYRKSLELAPGNATALHEIEYIQAVRSGAQPTTPGGLVPLQPH